METAKTWKTLSALRRSPTRLEGMETVLARISVWVVELSPTRLEGMETISLLPTNVYREMSPTRLEGMETNEIVRKVKPLILVSDPP